jgi:hypothetical protein
MGALAIAVGIYLLTDHRPSGAFTGLFLIVLGVLLLAVAWLIRRR